MENMKQTVLFGKNSCHYLNYETHTPVLFDKEKLTAMFDSYGTGKRRLPVYFCLNIIPIHIRLTAKLS